MSVAEHLACSPLRLPSVEAFTPEWKVTIMNTLFTRWLPAITETPAVRKTALGIAGLAFAGGAIAAPAIAAQHTPAERAADTATVRVEQPGGTGPAAGKPAILKQVTGEEKPTRDKLVPHGTQGAQSSIPLDGEKTANAKAIIKATKKAGLDERAAVIAIATSLQESKLDNLGHLGDRNDHDSQGLFQQRPSSGWGSVEQITDPQYSTTAFLNALKRVDGWQDMPLTAAAQTVQVSAFPFHYAQWENQAADIVAAHWNG